MGGGSLDVYTDVILWSAGVETAGPHPALHTSGMRWH